MQTSLTTKRGRLPTRAATAQSPATETARFPVKVVLRQLSTLAKGALTWIFGYAGVALIFIIVKLLKSL